MFKQFFICAALVAAFVTPSNAQQHPTTEQAKQVEALVNKAATLIESKGKAVFPEFRKQGSEWWFGETYLFAYDLKLNVLLVAAFPQNEGKNQTGKTDAKGKLYHDEFVKVLPRRAGRIDRDDDSRQRRRACDAARLEKRGREMISIRLRRRARHQRARVVHQPLDQRRRARR